jgi:hypothetical protein
MSSEAAPPVRRAGATYVEFAVKTAIAVAVVCLGFLFVVSAVVDDLASLEGRLRKIVKEEVTAVRLRGLLTTNPAVHHKVAVILEERGDIKGAIQEIELGLGLLELHSQDREAKERFKSRLKALESKLASAAKEQK